MDHHLISVLTDILLFFSISGIIVPLLQRIKISSLHGYLLCGMVIGPHGLVAFTNRYPWLYHVTIQETSTVHLLGELGIITLMFMIGLELSFERLRSLSRYIFGLGSAQIVVTGFVIFVIAKLFNNSLQASILIGASFALSSTAIVMKILESEHLLSRPVGILCFSILLMQDLAVIPILVLASSFTGSSETNVIVSLVSSLLLGGGVVAVIYFFGKKILTPLLRSISFSTEPEWLAAFVVFAVIGGACLTYAAGLSLALGAFIVGLLIAETEFKHEVEIIINPLKGLLLGIFFLSIGMMINLVEVLRYPGLLLLATFGIYTFKATILFVLGLLFRIPVRLSAQMAIYLAEPGEFALLILGVAMASQLMPAYDVQFFLLVTVVAMMLTPFLSKLAPLMGNLSQRFFSKQALSTAPDRQHLRQTVLIAGFGRIGQSLGHILEGQQVPYIGFDLDGECVQKFKKKGFRVIYGDARRKELWRRLMHVGVEAVVIAIDDYKSVKNIIQLLRREYPLLPIIVRARDIMDTKALYEQGANYVVTETLESSLRIAELLLEKLGTEPEQAHQIMKKIRTDRCDQKANT